MGSSRLSTLGRYPALAVLCASCAQGGPPAGGGSISMYGTVDEGISFADLTRAYAAGEVVFVKNCKVCHAPPGQPDQIGPGPLPDYPKLGGDTLVLGRDPTTVLRIILEGAPSPVTPNEKTTYSMPSLATLSDKEVADAATYIRNSWGNRASPVSMSEVKALRAAIGK